MDENLVVLYKKIILSVVALLYVLPTVLCVVLIVNGFFISNTVKQLGIKVDDLKKEISDMQVDLVEESQNQGDSDPYPNLYAPKLDSSFMGYKDDSKVAYLCFEGGPSLVTGHILDALAPYDIKGTFFLGTGYDDVAREMYTRIRKEGHKVAMGSGQDDYSSIYESQDKFLYDVNETFEHIYSMTGVAPDIYSFPGGSINAHNEDISDKLSQELQRRGFSYFDHNVSALDDSPSKPLKDEIYSNVVGGIDAIEKDGRLIILMHDKLDNYNTAQALPSIIDYLINIGYSFDYLSREIEPLHIGDVD